VQNERRHVSTGTGKREPAAPQGLSPLADVPVVTPPDVRPSVAAPSSGEGRAFLQRRIALFAAVMFWLLGVLDLFTLAMWELFDELRPPRTSVAVAIGTGSLVAILALWFVARRSRVYRRRQLRLIDSMVLLIAGSFLGVGAVAAGNRSPNIFTAFLFAVFIVFARVLIVPSTGRRTALLSTMAMVPVVLVCTQLSLQFERPLGMSRAVLSSAAVLFTVVSVLIATTGSTVIYGLRRRVRMAMRLGQYSLDEKVGEGGMGVVYKARHAMLKRDAAIKLLQPGREGVHNLSRFEREVQLTAKLTHPNTVSVFDYGRSPEGLFYYAMEYLEGTDLESLVRADGPQPPARVIHVLTQVCGALQEAHALGLIHRDIKPANIFLCRRGGVPDVAKVLDFGLVKEVETGPADPGSTGNIVVGTPGFLAPEAITAPETVGPSSDLYALGAVAYFLVSGLQVFEGSTVMEICSHHALTPPEPPSTRCDVWVPPDLEALILRCLHKDPGERPASAAALRGALGQLSEAEQWTEALAEQWWRGYEAEHSTSFEAADPTVRSPMEFTVDLDSRGLA